MKLLWLTFLLVTIVSLLCPACGSGQKELVMLVKQNQENLSRCQSDLTTAQVKEQVQVERSQKILRQIKSLTNQLDSEKKRFDLLELELAQSRINDSQHPTKLNTTSSSTLVHNLKELNQEQISLFVKEVGGTTKVIGTQIMAIFGKLKSQLIYSKKDHVLTAHARFKGYQSDLEFINHWNRTKRFSRAYVDKDKDIVLETEIDIEPGMSKEAIKSWLRGFGIILNYFQHNLRKHTKDGKKEPEKIKINHSIAI